MARLRRLGQFIVVLALAVAVLWALEIGLTWMFHYVMQDAEF